MRRTWVLVFDNLDDDRFLYEIPTVQQDGIGSNRIGMLRPTWEYFLTLHGLVVITSRSKRVASSMVEYSEIVTVEPMDQKNAVSLFEKKVGVQTYREDVVRLTAVLEFMPLAIVQAAAYIKQRTPRLSVTQYLEKFQRSDRQKISLLGYEGGHLRRDREAKNSILITWQIPFDHIRQTRLSAADLLSLMSFFDRQGVFDSLLRQGEEVHCGGRKAKPNPA